LSDANGAHHEAVRGGDCSSVSGRAELTDPTKDKDRERRNA